MQRVLMAAAQRLKRAAPGATRASAVSAASAATSAGSMRRSARLQSRETSSSAVPAAPLDALEPPAIKRKKTAAKPRTAKATVVTNADASASGDAAPAAAHGVAFKHGTLSRKYEQSKLATGKYTYVVGCDEAGRGPLAGPVVAAACYVPLDVVVEGVHDSKKLSEPQRELLFEQLTTHPRIKFAVSINSAQRIDEINILQASLEAMANAVAALDVPADFVFVDGNRMPKQLTVDAETVVQGDGKVYSIAAASVIAKVTRDRIMVEMDAKYPQYNLKQHKGYPTREHMAAIAKHGACEIHRMTFAPLATKDKRAKKPKKEE